MVDWKKSLLLLQSEWTYLDPETEYIHYVIGVDERGDKQSLYLRSCTNWRKAHGLARKFFVR